MLLGDDLMSVDLDNMMEGVPSAPTTPQPTSEPFHQSSDDEDRPMSGLSQLGGQDAAILAITSGDLDDGENHLIF